MNELREKIGGLLWTVWAGAVDTATSDDFRNEDGTLKEAEYIKAQTNIIDYYRKDILDAVITALPEKMKELDEGTLPLRERKAGYNYALNNVIEVLTAAKENR